MLSKIISFSIRNKLIIILFTLTVTCFGIFSLTQVAIDAVPDITNNQVQVITVSPNLSTQDVEQFITYPVELEMANLPGVTEIRSVSKFGLSVVTIVFNDKIGTYLPRQLIAEKLRTAAANIPEGFGTPEMGPITTGLGEIYQYILDIKPGYDSVYSVMDLRTIQDWIVKRSLSGIPGVVEINTWGGYLKQYEVALDPVKMNSRKINVSDVVTALEKNNNVAGGSYIEKVNESYFIRGDGLIQSLQDIESIVVSNNDGISVLIEDIASVGFGHATRFGAITGNGEGEKVLGQVMMLKDGNSNQVINRVKERIEEISKSLPEGVYINGFLERSELIKKTTLTIAENLVLGCLIVVFVVLILLGNLRSGLVIASLIPLCLLFALSFMYIFKIDANLMSLGAIDFGIIIDGAVIIVEFIALRININKEDIEKEDREGRIRMMDRLSWEGSSKMMNSAVFGQLIILLVFIPILSLSGVEGKMFKPMALTFSFALIGAMVFCFTWIPVASSLFLKPSSEGKRNISRILMKYIEASYTPVMRWAYDHKKMVLGVSLAAMGVSVFLFTRMGGEFVPTLDEGDFVIQPVLKTGTSLSKTIETTTRIENILLDKFPEVEQVVSRIGAAEVPTDPMSMEETDVIIKLKPKKYWVSAKSKDELADQIKKELMVIPGVEYEFTQPIEMRFNELITGVRADLAVKIFGEDINILNQKANEIKGLLSGVDGASDIIVEKTAGLPQMIVRYRRNMLAAYGLNIEDLNKLISLGFSGYSTGVVFEGEKRFDLVIRLDKNARQDLSDLKNLMVDLPGRSKIPMGELAVIEYDQGPAKISRENTHRRVVVGINVRGRDLESVVGDVREVISSKLSLPPGYTVDYGGQFENLRSARKRLQIALPVALLLIFIFLHFAFQSVKEAILVYTAIPLAAVGGILLLWIRGMPFSISAGVGFIALFGIAVLNGIVLIEHLKELKEEGIVDMKERIFTATRQRLRPVLLTASAAALGFLPMAISTSAGAEVQRPLATVVIGGLITSTLLTMIALPLLYSIFADAKKIRFFPFKIYPGKTGILILIMVMGGVSVSGQTQEFTREEAVRLALENNQELKSYVLAVTQAGQFQKTAYDLSNTTVYHSFDKNNVAANGLPLKVFGIQQSFDFPTSYSSGKKILNSQLHLQELQYEIRKNRLIRDVSLEYNSVQYLLHKQEIVQYLDSLYKNFSVLSLKRFESGESNYLESLNASSRHQMIKSRLQQIRMEVESGREKLMQLIQTDSIPVIPLVRFQRIPVSESNHLKDPGAEYFRERILQSESRIQYEKSKLMPGLSLEYFRGYNSGSMAVPYPGFQVGLSFPLFFGAQNAQIRASRLEREISMSLEKNYILETVSVKNQLLLDIERFGEALNNYEQYGKSLSSEIIRAANLAFSQGEINYFELVQSLETAMEMEFSYLDNMKEYNQKVLEYNFFNLREF